MVDAQFEATPYLVSGTEGDPHRHWGIQFLVQDLKEEPTNRSKVKVKQSHYRP
jgi:hypothetical protein